jgi:hypothetical protein
LGLNKSHKILFVETKKKTWIAEFPIGKFQSGHLKPFLIDIKVANGGIEVVYVLRGDLVWFLFFVNNR